LSIFSGLYIKYETKEVISNSIVIVNSYILYCLASNAMNTKILLAAVAIVAAFGIAAVAGPVTVNTALAQNMTGDNMSMTSDNMTAMGGNMTSGNMTS
jgi:hypothetical protein